MQFEIMFKQNVFMYNHSKIILCRCMCVCACLFVCSCVSVHVCVYLCFCVAVNKVRLLPRVYMSESADNKQDRLRTRGSSALYDNYNGTKEYRDARYKQYQQWLEEVIPCIVAVNI